MVTGWSVRYFVPLEYCSQAIMEGRADGGPRIWPKVPVPWPIGPFPELLQRKDILLSIIDNLKLCDDWAVRGRKRGRDEVYQELLTNMDVRVVPGTDLVQIRVYSTDRQEAASLANAIATVYQQKYRENQNDQMRQALRPLQHEVDSQRNVVNSEREAATRIRNNKGIIDPDPEKDLGSDHSVISDYTSAKLKYLNAKHVLEQAENRLDTQQSRFEESVLAVKVWERAEPADHPSMPKPSAVIYLRLANALIIAGGLIMGIGVFVFLIKRQWNP